MCEICDWEEAHPGETWPPPRIPEYGPPIDVGGLFTLQIAKPREMSDYLNITALADWAPADVARLREFRARTKMAIEEEYGPGTYNEGPGMEEN